MNKPALPLKHIRQLAKKMLAAGLSEIELRSAGTVLKLRAAPQIARPLPISDVHPALTPLPASMPGTVLLRHPSHGSAYVQIGQTVKSQDLLALLKVGAFYLPLRSPVDGVIARIDAQQDQSVEFGSNIMWLDSIYSASATL